MVSTRGKKKSGSLNGTAENGLTEKQTSDSLKGKVEGRNLGAEFEDKIEAEHVTNVDHDDGNTMATGMHREVESEQNTSEEHGEDDHEDYEDRVENLSGEDEAIEEQDDDRHGASEEESMGEEDSEEVAYSEEEMEDGDGRTKKDKEVTKVVGRDNEERNVQKLEISSKKKMEESSKRSRRLKKTEESSERSGKLKKMEEWGLRSRKKDQAQMRKKVESGERPESSNKQKMKKRVRSMGMIFMCSSKTKDDCYHYRVLGLPENKKDIVEKIYTGMRLFLYDVDLKLLYGIYKAAGPGGFNIEPKAFKSQFPSQVRFSIMDDCLPLPEENFRKVIRENYFTHTKFDCQLNSEQVRKLCKLFIATSKGKKVNKFRGLGNSEKPYPLYRERTIKQRIGDKRGIPLKDDPHFHELSHKRPKKGTSSVVPLHRTQPSAFPLYDYGRTASYAAPVASLERQDSYLESRSRYRERQDPIVRRRDSRRDLRDVPTEYSRYRDGRDVNLLSRYDRDKRDQYLLRRNLYRDGTGLYPGRRDPYKDGGDPYLEHPLPHRDRRDSYVDRRDLYRDERDPYTRIRDSYRDGRVSNSDRRGSYLDRTDSVPCSTTKRDPLADRHGVYREVQGDDYRDSYRRAELFEPDDTRRRHVIGNRDSFAAYQRQAYAEPIHTSEYAPRTAPGTECVYHL